MERAFGNSFYDTFGRAMDPSPQGNGAKVTVGLNIAMRVSVERDTAVGVSNEKSSMPLAEMPFGPVVVNSFEGREFSSIDFVKCSPNSEDSDGESQWGPVLVEEELDRVCLRRGGPVYQGQIGIEGNVSPEIPGCMEEDRLELRLRRLLKNPSGRWSKETEPRLKDLLKNPNCELSAYLEEEMLSKDCAEERGEPEGGM